MSAQKHPKPEHRTTESYIVGFILSLAFTAIPYTLVVNNMLTGSRLLWLILGFAFLQMAVQIFFFLHLGRGPKPLYNVGFFTGTFAAIIVVVAGSIYIMANLNSMSPADSSLKLAGDEGIAQVNGKDTGACQGVGENHKIIIKNGIVTPGYTEASRCDTLTFMREDDVDREITFGTSPQRGTYAGETDLRLRKGRGKSITLSQVGTYQFYDRLNPGTAGYFTVTAK